MITARSGNREALDEAALILLSPVAIVMGLFISPVLLVFWPIGLILLWSSRAWPAGAKLFGSVLSGVSFVWGGIIGFHFTWRNDGLGAAGVAMAVTLFLLLFLLQMTPSIASVIYLWRTRAPRGVRGRQSIVNDHHG